MRAHQTQFLSVVVTKRPTDLPPADFDPSDARLCRAKDVTAGDLVLGWVAELPGGRQAVDYHADAYLAAPVANNADCGCPGHASLPQEHRSGEMTVLTDGFPWDACDVMPSNALVLIIPADRPAPRPQQATTPNRTLK